ncbi:MAG: hypothetical protein GY909_10900 [Oligoflexia bacterium]|nr:hypothetical protein [Oligoflexia bacterium]
MIKNSLFLCVLVSIIFVSSCSSSKNEAFVYTKRQIIDYKVVESSHDGYPLWIRKPQSVGSKIADGEKYYFAFETTPKINKKIACNLLKAYGREKIVNEVFKFATKGKNKSVKVLLAENGKDLAMKNFKKTNIIQSFWEDRMYPPLPGDAKYRAGSVCAYLIEVKRSEISKIFKSYKLLVGRSFPNQSLVQEFEGLEGAFFRYRNKSF